MTAPYGWTPCPHCGQDHMPAAVPAALLATRDRYEAALREIAEMKATKYPEVNLLQHIAREALAAAPEDTNGTSA
jgi:hypothetical protein